MQIKTAEMPFLTCQVKIQKLDNTLYWQSYGETESIAVGMQIGTAPMTGNLAISNKTTYVFIPTLGIYFYNNGSNMKILKHRTIQCRIIYHCTTIYV